MIGDLVDFADPRPLGGPVAEADTTPCLAWDLLYDELGTLWACEGDTMALMTKYLV